MPRPTILFVAQFEPYPPPLFGAQIRIDRLLAAMTREFRVIFACTSRRDEETLAREWPRAAEMAQVISAARDTDNPADDPLWGSAFALLTGTLPHAIPAFHRYRWSSQLVEKMRAVLASEPVAAVWASRVVSAEMARAAGASRIVVDVDDLEGHLLSSRVRALASYKRRPLHRVQARAMMAHERALVSRFAGVVVCKQADLDALGDDGAAARWVVPNGTDLPPLATGGIVARENLAVPTILFVGALGYEPNTRAVSWFVSDVLPRVRAVLPHARLIVAGRGPSDAHWLQEMAQQGVTVHESPSDIASFYHGASVVIAPLLDGGGTSIKVLEALAYGRPLVATCAAVRGLAVEDDVHARITDDATTFASHCVRLLQEPTTAARLGEAGQALVTSRYTWVEAGRGACNAVRAAMVGGA